MMLTLSVHYQPLNSGLMLKAHPDASPLWTCITLPLTSSEEAFAGYEVGSQPDQLN